MDRSDRARGVRGPLRTGWLRAVVMDYDGTCTTSGRIEGPVGEAVEAARAGGLRVVLATGRIIDELLADEPDVLSHVDVVVAENGAVLWEGGEPRLLAEPVDVRLVERLAGLGVPARQGLVIVATRGVDDTVVLSELQDIGEDHQLVRNRGELMVAPAGVTKGTGARAALAMLGLSPHSALAVGDAENDHALFDSCEIGVAVADAVTSLRDRADIVLNAPDGAGVVELVREVLSVDEWTHRPSRWRLELGVGGAGEPVDLPASQINVLVVGDTGRGKSYAAGKLAEQMISMGYSTLIIDPEGDHVCLGALAGVTVVAGGAPLAPPDVVGLLGPAGGGVVVDLSQMPAPQRLRHAAALLAEAEAHRLVTGLPHWIVTDEAQQVFSSSGPHPRVAGRGHLLVSWRALELPDDVIASLDVVVAVGPPGDSGSADLAAMVGGVEAAEVERDLSEGWAPDDPTRLGAAVVARRWTPGRVRLVALGERLTTHHRHEHKYEGLRVADEQRFWFWRPPGTDLPETVVGSLGELEAGIAECRPSVLLHHSTGHEFSRWIELVVGSQRLAAEIRALEGEIATHPAEPRIEVARVHLLAALQRARRGRLEGRS